MRTLHIKLRRNLWTLREQGLAIALVIAAGVATFVMSLATLDSLRLTQQSVYASQHFASVFAELKRAPEVTADRLAEIPGVAQVATRVQAPVTVRVADFPDPVTGLMISVPDGRQPALNRLFLRAGQWPEAGRDDEVLLAEAFADAHGLVVGDRLAVVINGRYQRLRISGIALSPEYIYQIRPGELFPDFERFAVMWMNRSALGAAFGMEGAFNSVVLSLAPGQGAASVIEQVDALLAPWGGLGAHDREDQISHRYLEDELQQLSAMARFIPLVLIGVAAFLLNVVAARLIRTQREQIAVLKAFGYDSRTVALHYLMLVMVVVLLGSVAGVLLGVWLASGLASLYQDFFRFPWLEFRLRPSVAVAAVLIAGGATVLGTFSAVRAALKLPPAEAMRPAPPARYRRTVIERLGLQRLSQPSRMILRNLERQPVKAGLSMLGIAFAVSILMLTGFSRGAINHMVDVQYRLAQKQDVTVIFNEPVSWRAVHELRSLPGVQHAEAFRVVPGILRNGHRSYRGAVHGYRADSALFHVLDRDLQPLVLPEEGAVITDHLARLLDIRPGDTLYVSVQEGRRPTLAIPVAGLVTEYIGVGVYMQQPALERLLREGGSASGAFLAVDPTYLAALQQALEDRPTVAAISLRETLIRAFRDLMEDNILLFTLFSLFLAGTIAFAVVYNNARIAFAERNRELASLRVLGFTRAEITFILLGELVLLTLLALPLGFALGAGLCALMTIAMQTDLYRIPLVLTPATYAWAAAVVLGATLLSSLMIGRLLRRLDMVTALKGME
ncbi:ABC transporter permease [Isoalcanivorax indicus]|uniref:ABC transporter permease n=1 Tax=Isoalcanivorax indicus TaxID=2202653 RepID=UPI000DB94416|nr:FtsX-like permease family protein [Isoalcanivorax indicus]